MAGVATLPVNGAVFLDPRDAGRSLRITSHPELGVTVLSIWRADVCVGTFRLRPDELHRLLHTLVDAAGARSSHPEMSQCAIDAGGGSSGVPERSSSRVNQRTSSSSSSATTASPSTTRAS
jgi:hypothetical protein